MNIDKINQALAARDKAMNDASAGHSRKVTELQEAFAAEQKALAQKYVDAEMESLAASNAAFDAAVEAFDKALADLAAEDQKALEDAVKSNNGNGGNKSVAVATPTAVDVANKFAFAALKAEAKKLGVSTTGTEVVVAQRLIDAGWKP